MHAQLLHALLLHALLLLSCVHATRQAAVLCCARMAGSAPFLAAAVMLPVWDGPPTKQQPFTRILKKYDADCCHTLAHFYFPNKEGYFFYFDRPEYYAPLPFNLCLIPSQSFLLFFVVCCFVAPAASPPAISTAP